MRQDWESTGVDQIFSAQFYRLLLELHSIYVFLLEAYGTDHKAVVKGGINYSKGFTGSNAGQNLQSNIPKYLHPAWIV